MIFFIILQNDLIFSDLSDKSFLYEGLLHHADVVSSSNSMCNGPLQIYRNNFKLNNLFRHSADYKFIVNSSKYWGFDENHGTLKTPFPKVIRKKTFNKYIRWKKTSISKLDDRFYFKHGKLHCNFSNRKVLIFVTSVL